MAARLLGVACWLQASAALAHPGHGGLPAGSWLHGLAPSHLAPALAFALLAGAALRRRAAAARERRR